MSIEKRYQRKNTEIQYLSDTETAKSNWKLLQRVWTSLMFWKPFASGLIRIA